MTVTESEPTLYVFDLDGVITDPRNSQVDAQLVQKMYQLLADGTALAVNTGRSYEWVEKNLIRSFETYGGTAAFTRLAVVCEKGGEIITWQNGRAVLQSSEFALPTAACEQVRALYNEHAQKLQTMFWDDTKRTMATLEKRPEADLAAFHAQQQLLVALLAKAFSGRGTHVDPTTIATDVQLPAAGKYAGAELIYDWVHAAVPQAAHSFVSFGDSISDYEMARCFAEHGAASKFVYVGKPGDTPIVEHPDVKLIKPARQYAAGTLEYLG